MRIEAVAGMHPYGALEDLFGFLSAGQAPFRERGMAECPASAFTKLKALHPSFRRTPRLARLALAAALELPHFRKERAGEARDCALVVATAFGSVVSTFDFMDSLLADGPDMASPTAFSHSVTNMTAAMLGQHLRLAGPATTITDAGGDPFFPALLAAAGILESDGIGKVFLCAVEESQPLLNEIIAAHSGMRPGMEGAVMFVLSRDVSETSPHIDVSPVGDAHHPNGAAAASTIDVHGPGSLAPAWNAALSFLSLRESAGAPILCQSDSNTKGKPVVRLSVGEQP